jgi:hypothetical protein
MVAMRNRGMGEVERHFIYGNEVLYVTDTWNIDLLPRGYYMDRGVEIRKW